MFSLCCVCVFCDAFVFIEFLLLPCANKDMMIMIMMMMNLLRKKQNETSSELHAVGIAAITGIGYACLKDISKHYHMRHFIQKRLVA